MRSLVSALYLSVPFCFFLLGMLWRSLGWHLQIIAGSVFFLEVLNGLLNFSKFQIISALLALVIGTWVSRHTLRFLAMTMVMVAAVFMAIHPLVNSGRAHLNYHPTENSVATRFAILADVVLRSSKAAGSGNAGLPTTLSAVFRAFHTGLPDRRVRKRARRNSLDDFWAAMIPRVLWPANRTSLFRPGALRSILQTPPTSACPDLFCGSLLELWPGRRCVGIDPAGAGVRWLTLRWQLAKRLGIRLFS